MSVAPPTFDEKGTAAMAAAAAASKRLRIDDAPQRSEVTAAVLDALQDGYPLDLAVATTGASERETVEAVIAFALGAAEAIKAATSGVEGLRRMVRSYDVLIEWYEAESDALRDTPRG